MLYGKMAFHDRTEKSHTHTDHGPTPRQNIQGLRREGGGLSHPLLSEPTVLDTRRETS